MSRPFWHPLDVQLFFDEHRELNGLDVSAKINDYVDRSELWPDEMKAAREVLLGCGLLEEIKWGKPCYSVDGANIVILQEMKSFLALMFFKGALMGDPAEILEPQGPNSRSAMRICIRSVDDVTRLATTLSEYVDEAIKVEAAGLEVGPASELVLVAELQTRLDNNETLNAAFHELTPGRRREYNLHFSDAKQSKTREARVEKYISKILAGKGFRDR